MAMTKSRRASKPAPAVDGWEALAIAVGRDFEEFMLKICEGERHAATIYRRNYADNRRCSYDQATHSMFLDLIGQEAACTELLRRFVVLQSERIDQLERELKKTKSHHTKSLGHGFTLEDLEVEQIDDRNIKIGVARGDKEASFTLKFPVVIDRGIWNERAMYERGDGVSHGGSWWVASKDSPGKPGDGSWRLAVKRGRDGKNAA